MNTNRQQQNAHTLVTGGAGGIGAATITALRERGHLVTSLDLGPHPDPNVLSVTADITQPEEVSRAIDQAQEQQGVVTGLVACHGIRGAFVPALEMSPDHLRRLFDIHTVGAFIVSCEIVKRLGGTPASIVLISSTTAYGGWKNQADYGPAKAAETQLMKNLAIEWASLNVRVNAVAPGHTMTNMVRDLVDRDSYDLSEVESRMPLGRLATPSEMAESIAWLLSDATFVTGQCVAVDGGWTAVGK